MAKTICLFSQKGGAGKTTTAVNLAAVFALSRKRTLLVDCDPQGAATSISCTDPYSPKYNLSAVLIGSLTIDKTIVQGCLHCLKVIPAPSEPSIDYRLKFDENTNALILKRAFTKINDNFDYIILDTPASDWPYITMASAASDFVLLVLKPDYFAFRLLGKSIYNIRMIKRRYNPGLKSVGVIINMYDQNDQNSIRILHSAQKHLSNILFNTIILKVSKISESTFLGKPFVVSYFKDPATQYYIQLAKELMSRMR